MKTSLAELLQVAKLSGFRLYLQSEMARRCAANPLGYRFIDTQSTQGAQGGIWPCPPEGHPIVVLYIAVDDVAASVERACQLGGNVVIPPQKLPEGDEMAVIHDPEGLAVGLFKPASGSN